MAKYSIEFRKKVVNEYLEGCISLKDLAEKYKLPHQEVARRWVNIYKTLDYEGLKAPIKNNNYSL